MIPFTPLILVCFGLFWHAHGPKGMPTHIDLISNICNAEASFLDPWPSGGRTFISPTGCPAPVDPDDMVAR